MSLNWNELSAEEKALIISEVAERIKDITFMQAREKATEVLEQLPSSLRGDDAITITYEIHMLGNDLIQILGRKKRRTK